MDCADHRPTMPGEIPLTAFGQALCVTIIVSNWGVLQ